MKIRTSILIAASLLLVPAAALAAPNRLQTCLKTKNCAFGVWGAGVPNETKMSFWVLKSEWKRFSTEDKLALKKEFARHLQGMRGNPELYASNKEFGAKVGAHGSAYPFIVENISKATKWVVFLSPGKNERGSLRMSDAAEDYLENF